MSTLSQVPSRSEDVLFEPCGFMMVRAPLLPTDVLLPLFEAVSTSGGGVSDGELAAVLDGGVLATRAYLREQLEDVRIREALLAGSPDLFSAIPRWVDEPTTRKGRQAEINVLRYVLRMATRPTPFGLFASVAFGHIAPQTQIQLGPMARNRKRTRPDMQWLLALIYELEQRSDVMAQVRFFTNPVMFVSAGRLYIPYLDSYGQETPTKTVSLRATPVVMRALELARSGMVLGQLHDQIQVERPHATATQIGQLLMELRQQGALLSDLRPPLTCHDTIGYVLDRIAMLPGCDDVRMRLCGLQSSIAAYDAQPIGQGITALQALYEAAEMPGTKIRSALELDMVASYDTATLSSVVASELAQAAAAMFRMTTANPSPRHLMAYRQAFLARYNEGCEVPLLELLDEDIGLGPPPTYQCPPPVREVSPAPQPSYPARDRALLGLAAQALRDGQREVVLDEALLAQLQTREQWHTLVPDSLEVYATIAAVSQEAIDRGDFLAVIGPRIGDHPAGRSFGRFCDLLGAESLGALAGLARAEEERMPARIFAELVYLPSHGHAANVALRPAIREYEVVVAVAPGVDREKTLPMHDLVVGVRGDRFYVRSRALGAEVVTRSTHLLTAQRAPNVCRFLTEVGGEGSLPITPFDWGAATDLPFLPRVRVGRTVLHPAQWRLPRDLVAQGAGPVDSVVWYRAFQRWRVAWQVPRFVYLTESDNRLLLDLENPVCVGDLADVFRRRGDGPMLILQEMVPGFDALWEVGSAGRHVVEFIVPLRRCRPAPPPPPLPPARDPITVASRLRPIGSGWLFAKVYSGLSRHDDMIAGPLRTFTDEVLRDGLAERWFFIRYNDPEPHIRLRFRGEPTVLMGKLLPALAAWAQSLVEHGLAHKLVLDSYDPEIERYGGPAGLACAEDVFAADSSAAAAIVALRLRHVVKMTSLDLALLTVDDLVRRLGVSAAQRQQLYRALRIRQESFAPDVVERLRAEFHGYRPTAQRIVGDREWLRSQAGGAVVEEILQQRAVHLALLGSQVQALVASDQLWVSLESFLASCIHMHCNRLLGIDRAQEFAICYHLDRTFESLARYTPPGIQLDGA